MWNLLSLVPNSSCYNIHFKSICIWKEKQNRFCQKPNKISVFIFEDLWIWEIKTFMNIEESVWHKINKFQFNIMLWKSSYFWFLTVVHFYFCSKFVNCHGVNSCYEQSSRSAVRKLDCLHSPDLFFFFTSSNLSQDSLQCCCDKTEFIG